MGIWSKIGNAVLIAIAGYEIGSKTNDEERNLQLYVTQKPAEIKTNDEESSQVTTIVIIILIIIICILKLHTYYKNYINKKVNNNVV